jgi:phage-related protein (TIGR01555 family)
VAGSDIPHTRLLGNSPSGLGATGLSETLNYYDSVKSMQEVHLRGPIELLVELLFQQEGSEEKPQDLTFEFNPLFQQDEETAAKSREKQALIDEKYINMGVYDPDEVANSRFGTGRFSYETVLEEGRKRELRTAQVGMGAVPSPEKGNSDDKEDDILDGL